jgi:MFS family permease
MINIPELSILILFKFQNHLLTLFGQKNYILLGLLICFIANLFLGCLELPTSTDTIQYIGLQARMIQGFGINMMQTAAISLVCILFNTDKQRHMSVIQSAIGTGEVVGPFIGSTFFHTLGFPLSFGALNVMIMFMLLSFNR